MAKATDLDELFQRPLSEFTSARNALAKTAGKDGAEIKALSKPPLAAWAVNQLYWQDRDRYEALIDAAGEMRRTHKSVIEGKRGDLRAASREHEIAVEAALKATLSLLKDSGTPATPATRQAILNTLRALPSSEAPGRLTQALIPGGFEMLAGVTPGTPPKQTTKTVRGGTAPAGKIDKRAEDREREAARSREQRAAAERAIRDADQRTRQAEFEAARAARDATKSVRRVEQARKSLEDAQSELDAAERDAERAEHAKETADERLREAQAALAAAKSKRLP